MSSGHDLARRPRHGQGRRFFIGARIVNLLGLLIFPKGRPAVKGWCESLITNGFARVSSCSRPSDEIRLSNLVCLPRRRERDGWTRGPVKARFPLTFIFFYNQDVYVYSKEHVKEKGIWEGISKKVGYLKLCCSVRNVQRQNAKLSR